MKGTNIETISETLDGFFRYQTFKPDSMVAIVNLLDPDSKRRFSKDYLENKTGLMQANGDFVKEVLCAVFPGEDIFDHIDSKNVNDALLFIKHAMEWEELGRGFVTLTDEQLKLLKDRRISLYSAHAPVDNDTLFSPSMCFARQLRYDIVDELAINGRNYGWVLDVPEGTNYDSLHQRLIGLTGLKEIQRYRHHNSVKKIGVAAGGGDNIPVLDQLLSKDCDTFVTGILFFQGSEYAREHNPFFLDRLKASGLNAFGASHYLTEVEGIKTLASCLEEVLPISVNFIEEQKKHRKSERSLGVGVMTDSHQGDVLRYFKGKASGYDLVEGQVYWRLSDQLLWQIFEGMVLSKLTDKFRFLDAGGGTGRWSEKVLRNYEGSKGIIYDLSPDMLQQAEQKRKDGLESRLELRMGSIEKMNDVDNEVVDLTFCFHNVLGFVYSPQNAINEMVRVTKKGGYVVSVVPNQYHCVFFNLMLGRVEEAAHAANEGLGRFTLDMPYMHLFTPSNLRKTYREAGLIDVSVFGFPVAIYPGMQETQITGSTEKIADILENSEKYGKIFEIEKRLSTTQECAARGNNLFIVGINGRL